VRDPICLAICGQSCYISDIIAHSWALSGNEDRARSAGSDAGSAEKQAVSQELNRAEATGRMSHGVIIKFEETGMAKGEQKGNREAKKPKKEKIKTIAAAPSQKTAGWQPSFGSGKKK
jgi:hypothetical protein